jgi:hypothetical protein
MTVVARSHAARGNEPFGLDSHRSEPKMKRRAFAAIGLTTLFPVQAFSRTEEGEDEKEEITIEVQAIDDQQLWVILKRNGKADLDATISIGKDGMLQIVSEKVTEISCKHLTIKLRGKEKIDVIVGGKVRAM